MQVFLVATLASAISSVINDIIDRPETALTILPENLPKASNFYISYFILMGLSSAAGTLLNIGGFVVVVLLGRVLPGKTPRKIFDKLTKLSGPSWGSEFPKWINLGVIAITYCGIAPLVLGFATVGFSLVYVAFRYNFLYVYETQIDTKGDAYQKALRQLMTGVYLSELCLIGLFAIATGDHPQAAGPLAIMCVLLLITLIFQFSLKQALKHEEARLAYTDPNGTPHNANNLEKGNSSDTANKQNGYPDNNGNTNAAASPEPDHRTPKKSRMPSFLAKVFNPSRHSIHALSASLDQFYHTPQEPLPIEIQKRAYFNPSVTSPTPVIWIVKDDMGISQMEIRDCQKAVPGLRVTDEQAVFNEKGKVHWFGTDDGKAREAPVFDERIVY